MQDGRVPVDVVVDYILEDLDTQDLIELKNTIYTALVTQRNSMLIEDYILLLGKLVYTQKELTYREIIVI